MIAPVGGIYNKMSAAFDTVAKTLTISGCAGFDLTQGDLISVYNTTRSSNMPIGTQLISCTLSYVAGLPLFTYLFNTIPAGYANGDTLVIRVQIPDWVAVYSLTA